MTSITITNVQINQEKKVVLKLEVLNIKFLSTGHTATIENSADKREYQQPKVYMQQQKFIN